MSACNSQDDWDEICVNPHQSHMNAGRHEGREAGLQAGFKDGFALGRTKGIEFGMELGFIRGFINSVESKIQSSSQEDVARNERLQKRVDDLRRAIDEFPSADSMFANTINDDVPNNEDDSETADASESTDLMGSMQRIRAKFKVLAAQLKIPHYSLKQVMTDAVQGNGEESRKHIGDDPNMSSEGQKMTGESQNISSEW